jgi:hypothetical protein
MFTLLSDSMYAQTVGKEAAENISQEKFSVKTAMLGFSPRKVSWWDSGNGFICKTSLENVAYLTRFDKQGKYVETLIRKAWNDSSALQPSFQESQYKLNRVTSYWEVLDKNQKGYYLEMKDSESQASSVWIDDQGNFSNIPGTKTVKIANAGK